MLALVGGAEWTAPAAALDAWLLEQSGSHSVTVLPTANRAHPDLAVATARRHFAALGGDVVEAAIRTRAHAEQPSWRERLGSAPFLYLAGGDPGHLATVLAGTPAWAGVLDAVGAGAVVAGSSAGAMVFGSRMIRPGAGGTEPGLGLLPGVVVLPHFERWPAQLAQVADALAAGVAGTDDVWVRVLGIDECTGLVLASPGDLEGGSCRVLGAGSVSCLRQAAGPPHAQPHAQPGPALVPAWVVHAPAEVDGCLAGRP